jgi:hypothetical protein
MNRLDKNINLVLKQDKPVGYLKQKGQGLKPGIQGLIELNGKADHEKITQAIFWHKKSSYVFTLTACFIYR